MAGNPQKKSTGIVNAAIGALAVVLAILIVWMMNLVSGIQGTARIINYAGLVRGKTQRIVKLEISGQPQDGMIADIDAFIDGLRFGSDELSLVRLNNDAFQSKMQELDDYFQALKQEIGRVRAVGSNNTDIIPISETFFGICDDATGLAEAYSQRKATSLSALEKYRLRCSSAARLMLQRTNPPLQTSVRWAASAASRRSIRIFRRPSTLPQRP